MKLKWFDYFTLVLAAIFYGTVAAGVGMGLAAVTYTLAKVVFL